MTTAVLPTTGEASDLDALDTLASAPEGGSSSTELELAPEIVDAELVDDIVLPQATATWTPPPVRALWVEPSALVDNPRNPRKHIDVEDIKQPVAEAGVPAS